ncbi:MAG: deoxyribonuclease IV [Clostridia bacterium]
MAYIGCHLSSAAGYLAMGKEAQSIGADTFQFFTRNPRGGQAKPMDVADAQALCMWRTEHAFGPIVAHAPYTLNACAAKPDLRVFARAVLAEDLQRLAHLPGTYYNLHPGSHVGQGVETGIALIAQTLNDVLQPDQIPCVLLETMAGKGSEVGATFEELRDILAAVHHTAHMGVCLDTCHVYDAGYDIVEDLDGVLTHFDDVIGLTQLRAIHINDSKNPFLSHKDRHEKLGEGSLGLDALVRILRHPKLSHLPFILETPNELPGYAREIAQLRAEIEA